jgi:sporulation protein YlmC with PRC-barrel domain
MEAVDMQQVRADDLIGSDVYGANDDNIGNVGDILLTEEGSFDAIIVDVGGFLGIGAREVALSLDEVEFMRDQNENWYVYTGYTQEQLEAAPEYDEATYAEQRDNQRVAPQ